MAAGLPFNVAEEDPFANVYYEKLVCICAFNLVGSSYRFITMHEVATKYRKLVSTIMKELLSMVTGALVLTCITSETLEKLWRTRGPLRSSPAHFQISGSEMLMSMSSQRTQKCLESVIQLLSIPNF